VQAASLITPPNARTRFIYIVEKGDKVVLYIGRGLLMQRDQDKLTLSFISELSVCDAERIKQKGTAGNN
jgi:hypothetical protein